ncbi:interferon gamma [Carlito syrichta]|uniref:Interferon gamma n=1 Tax=Carlito syrichta TaxID=1868482 RepID=A0A1U7U7S4_CARSF|nr:interferon gamma [Carlito syrichta]
MNYSSYVLAFQLCVILGSSGYYCQTRLINETEKLKSYFDADESDVSDNGTLFLDVMRSWKEEGDRKIIQSQIVSFYFKLFENLKDNQHIKNSVNTIKEDMIVKFFNSDKDKVEAFKNLTFLSVNDTQIQRKAIHELLQVVLNLAPRSNLKRKRSQMLFRGRRAPK